MLSRILTVLIFGFWIVMSALLVRSHLNPGESGVMTVPVEHVVKLIFLHGQPSDLNIMVGDIPFGALTIRPTSTESIHTLECNGSARLRIPMVPRDQLIWETEVDLEPDYSFRTFRGIFRVRDRDVRLGVEVDAGKKVVHYRLSDRSTPAQESVVPLSREGGAQLLERSGMNPAVLSSLEDSAGETVVSARRTDLKFRDEQLDAYQIAVKREGVVLAEVYVSQLGQILLVKTPVLTLSPSQMLP